MALVAAESDLVGRAKVGDHEAFAALRQIHARQVRGFIRSRARSDADADDIEQQTWLTVWTGIGRYNPGTGPFIAFAKLWAKRCLLRFYHRTRYVVVLFSTLGAHLPASDEADEILEIVLGQCVRVSAEAEETQQATERLAAYEHAFLMTFERPIPPHQYLAFGFVKLLEWTPAALAATHEATPLRVLTQEFEAAYMRESQLPASHVRRGFARLRECMGARLGDVVLEQKTREAHKALLSRVVGETAFGDYAPVPPLEAHVTRWWSAVTRRAGKALRHAGIAGTTQGTPS